MRFLLAAVVGCDQTAVPPRSNPVTFSSSASGTVSEGATVTAELRNGANRAITYEPCQPRVEDGTTIDVDLGVACPREIRVLEAVPRRPLRCSCGQTAWSPAHTASSSA